jgi:hypothetical protein
MRAHHALLHAWLSGPYPTSVLLAYSSALIQWIMEANPATN